MVDALLCPSRGRKRNVHSFHGLRCAREDAGCASPVATFLGPFGGRKARRGVGVLWGRGCNTDSSWKAADTQRAGDH